MSEEVQLDIRKNFFTEEWSGTGTGCLVKGWSHHPWMYSKQAGPECCGFADVVFGQRLDSVIFEGIREGHPSELIRGLVRVSRRVEDSIPAGIHFPREQVVEFLSLAKSFLEHQQNIYPPLQMLL